MRISDWSSDVCSSDLASRPARQIASNTASSAAVSDAPAGITGLMSSLCSPKAREAILISWLFIQFLLPRMVLISPLCANVRKGWASHHCGRSEEHTSELQSPMRISYAVFCLKKKTTTLVQFTLYESRPHTI